MQLLRFMPELHASVLSFYGEVTSHIVRGSKEPKFSPPTSDLLARMHRRYFQVQANRLQTGGHGKVSSASPISDAAGESARQGNALGAVSLGRRVHALSRRPSPTQLNLGGIAEATFQG